MKSLLQRLHRSAVAWSFFAALLRVGANVFVLPFVLRKIPTDELGLWYVFGTIGSLASLLDLGFEPTITRLASYAWGGASRFTAFGFHEDNVKGCQNGPNLTLLRDLVATLKAYYFYVGLAILLVLSSAGSAWVWVATKDLPSPNELRLAWLVYAAGCSLNFITGRWPALLSGIGAIRDAQIIGIVSQFGYYILTVGGLLAGAGIWALVFGFLALGFISRNLGQHYFKKTAGLSPRLPPAHLHREIFLAIWPNAWRTGLVGIGAFLIVQSNTLVCSGFLGLKTTASYGLSFQIVNMLFGLCGVWVAVKVPQINLLRVQHRDEEIIDVFTRRMRLMIICYLFGTLCLLFLAPSALRLLGSKTALLPGGQLAALALIRFLELHHTQYASLVLSENRNPFLKLALFTGVAIVASSLILTPLLGVWGLLISTGIVQACCNNWWPVWRALSGLNLNIGDYFKKHFLSPKAWLEF